MTGCRVLDSSMNLEVLVIFRKMKRFSQSTYIAAPSIHLTIYGVTHFWSTNANVDQTVIELRNYQVREATRRLLTKGRKFPTRVAVEAGGGGDGG